jgi:hypothetical protein
MPEAKDIWIAGTVYVKANLFEVENTDADIPISGGIRKPTEWSRWPYTMARTLARSLFTTRSTFWINPFGIVTPHP